MILLAWYFVALSWFGGYVSGYHVTVVGPFQDKAQCDRTRATMPERIERSNCWEYPAS